MAFDLDIDASVSFATAYNLDGSPLATVQRARIYTSEPAWTAFDLKGQVIGTAGNQRELRRLILAHQKALKAPASNYDVQACEYGADGEEGDAESYCVLYRGETVGPLFGSRGEALDWIATQPAVLPTYEELCEAATFVHKAHHARRGDRYATDAELEMILGDPLAWDDMVAAEVCAAFGCAITSKGGRPFTWALDVARHEAASHPETLMALRVFLAAKAVSGWANGSGLSAATVAEVVRFRVARIDRDHAQGLLSDEKRNAERVASYRIAADLGAELKGVRGFDRDTFLAACGFVFLHTA